MPANSIYRQQMFSMIEDWKQSKQTQQAYCKGHSINYHRFYYWYKQYKANNAAGANQRSSFISLSMPATSSSAELIYPDGRRILFHQGVDANYLKALLG
jgi:hypothetical protein